jgi:hypothetical protein
MRVGRYFDDASLLAIAHATEQRDRLATGISA